MKNNIVTKFCLEKLRNERRVTEHMGIISLVKNNNNNKKTVIIILTIILINKNKKFNQN